MNGPAITRRSAIIGATAAAFLPMARAHAVAGRTARIVVGAAPGGGTDTVARLLAEALPGHGYAASVIVENRPGASSRLAADTVKAAAADGATSLLVPMPVLTLSPHVFVRTTRFHPLNDFTAVATVGELVYGLVVRADHPARDLDGFLARARQQGSATFAPPVLGAPQHMLGLMLARRAGVEFTVISYRGGAPAQIDLLAGRLDCFMSHMAELSTNLSLGQTRLLAVSAATRMDAHPEVPTFAEAGYPELTAREGFCLMMPAGVSAAAVATLHRAVAAAVEQPALRERLVRLSIRPLVLGPDATAARLREEFAGWVPVVRASGFTAEE